MKGNCYGDFVCSKNTQMGDFALKDNGQMGDFLSDLWNKGVTAVENLAVKQVDKLISNVTGPTTTSVPASNVVTQTQVVQGQNTTSTQYVEQPMTEFQKKALLYGGIAVGGIVLLGLVKTIFPAQRPY